jgi:1-acyl-sn-glycerol-3-phosphate acyltransferase
MLRLALSPIRTVIAVGYALLATGLAAMTVTVQAWRDPKSNGIQRVIDYWSKSILAVAGISLTVEGIDNIEAGRTYVVVSNHQSAFDIPAQFQAIPIPIRFFAKKELFGIPVFGTALRAIGIVEVDRQAGAAVHGQINAHSAEVVARGHSVLVYAEGTRFQDGPVHPFKRGAFSIAIEAGLPILPAMVYGGHLAWPPKRPILGGPMKVAIGRPIETAGLTRKNIADLRDQTKQAIERMVDAAV